MNNYGTYMDSPTFGLRRVTSKTGSPFLYRAFSPMERGSVRGSIFALASTAIGAGILSLPYVLATCGLLLGIFLVGLGAVLALVSLNLLIECAHVTGIKNYAQLARELFGPKAGLFLNYVFVVVSFPHI